MVALMPVLPCSPACGILDAGRGLTHAFVTSAPHSTTSRLPPAGFENASAALNITTFLSQDASTQIDMKTLNNTMILPCGNNNNGGAESDSGPGGSPSSGGGGHGGGDGAAAAQADVGDDDDGGSTKCEAVLGSLQV